MPARKFHHATIREPGDFTPGSFRTIRTSKALDADGAPRFIIGRLKGQTTPTPQAVLFPDYWTRRRVDEWLSFSGKRPIRVEWANPHLSEGNAAGLRSALEFCLDHVRGARRYIEVGDSEFAKSETNLAEKALHRAAGFAGLALRTNPNEERYTSAQTHIREAIVHLVQADKDESKGQLAAALEAVESAADHIDKALASMAPDVYGGKPTRNVCALPDRNPPAAGGRAVKWHPCRGPACKSGKRKAANPAAPRQLVRLGDVLELRMADGSTHKWARGERAMLVSPGVEKSSAGRASIIVAGVKAAKPAPRGPHKTSERTHETWHGVLPTGAKVADIPGPDEFQKAAGRVKAIVYYSLKWHDRASYIHEFQADALPGLFAGPRGTYEIRGGQFRVTARGIVN